MRRSCFGGAASQDPHVGVPCGLVSGRSTLRHAARSPAMCGRTTMLPLRCAAARCRALFRRAVDRAAHAPSRSGRLSRVRIVTPSELMDAIPCAVLSHESAARELGIALVNAVTVRRATVPCNVSHVVVAGWVVRRCDVQHQQLTNGLRVTLPGQTVVDLARVLPLNEAVAGWMASRSTRTGSPSGRTGSGVTPLSGSAGDCSGAPARTSWSGPRTCWLCSATASPRRPDLGAPVRGARGAAGHGAERGPARCGALGGRDRWIRGSAGPEAGAATGTGATDAITP